MGKIATAKTASRGTKTETTREILARKKDELRKVRAKIASSAASTTSVTRSELAGIEKELEREKARRARRMEKGVDVAFMLDCTGSMADYIRAAKRHIGHIMTEIKKTYRCSIRVAFVGYRDHCDGEDRIQVLDFVKDADAFAAFLVGVKAIGGGDYCEDVFGGLEAVGGLGWSQGNRCLIHIGDAPPHGSRFHEFSPDAPEDQNKLEEESGRDDDSSLSSDDSRSSGENYMPEQPDEDDSDTDSDNEVIEGNVRNRGDEDEINTDNDDDYHLNYADSRGLRIEDLIQKLKDLKIYYIFGKINRTTDKMVRVFNEVSGRKGFVHCSDMADVKRFALVAFESISFTIQSSWERGTLSLPSSAAMSSFGSAILRKSLRSYKIVKTQPDWNEVPIRFVRIALVEVTDGKKVILDNRYKKASVKWAEEPFAEGGHRISYYGIEMGKDVHFFDGNSNSDSATVVLKNFKHVYRGGDGGDDRNECLGIVRSQAVAKYLAREFNRVKHEQAKFIHFLDVKLVETEASDGSPQYYTIEDIFPTTAEFVKFNNNWGYVNMDDFTSTLNAFSHWTYDHTEGYLMVVDLQGIFFDKKYFLTDPAIHCKEPRFGRTNMGKTGMKAFFEAHKCNQVCTLMTLKSNRYMRKGSRPDPDLTSV